jgi:hypothetical protein
MGRLGGLHSRSGRGGEEKKKLLLQANEPWSSNRMKRRSFIKLYMNITPLQATSPSYFQFYSVNNTNMAAV